MQDLRNPPDWTIFSAMISLTEQAARKIEELRQEKAPGGDQLMRIFVEPGGCSGFEYGMSFDAPKPDDNQFESHGVTILVDPASADYLKGSEVHFDDGLQGKGFEVRNPNAANTCGCGRSFS